MTLHPLRIALHWDPTLTCGSCVHRQWVLAKSGVTNRGRSRKYAKCMRPVEMGGKITHPYKLRTDVPTDWPACMAHKEKGRS